MNLTGKTSHGLFSRVLALVCVLCLLAGAGLAETIVIIDDLVYGEDAFNLHMDDVPNTFTFEGEKYTFDGHYIDVKAYRLYGGNTRALHEYSVPHKEYSVEDDGSQKHLVTITLNPRRKTTLRIAEGNRVSGEFTVSEPIVLTDPWVDEVYLPRDAAGHPVLVDRIYLYSYQEGGETKRYATGLYIDYENYTARHAQDDIVDQLMDEIANTIEESRLIDVPVFYMSVSGELLAEGKVSALKGETKTVEANMKLIPGYDVVGETKVDVTFGENGPEPAQVFFMCTTAAPTPTPEPAFVMVPVYYMTTTGEVLVKQEVKCFEGTETTVEVDLSLVPGLVLINNASAVITVSNQVAAPSQVFFMCGPEPTATPTLAPTATPTLAPTATPTLVPTATPTLAPTATPAPYAGYAVTAGNNVLMRAYANTNAEIINVLTAGEVVWVLGQEYVDGDAWQIARFNGMYGYIRGDQLRMMSAEEQRLYEETLRTATPPPQATPTVAPITQQSMSSYGYVTNDNVRLRDGAGTDKSYLRMMNRYAFALVLGTEEVNGKVWYHINHSGTEGYVMSDYFKVLTHGELTDFLTSDEYLGAQDTPVGNTGSANPGSGLTSYEPFSNLIATPTPDVEAIQTPSPTPTLVPTAVSTLVPTATPTLVPTATPTLAPTAEPVEEPVDMGDILFVPEECDDATLFGLNDEIKTELEKRIAVMQATKPAEDFLYASNGTEVRINKYIGKAGDVIFPDEINGQPVTLIANGAFSQEKLFKAIRLPRYLREIGSEAFNYNYGLTGDLVLPETLEKVSSKAFIDANFTGLYIQSSCDISSVQTFAWMDKCQFVYIKDGCQVKIGATTFTDAETMTAAVIPASVTEIADKAFDGCNRVVIYTPAGSYAEEYAKRNFISVNTAEYEQMAALYAEKLAALNAAADLYSYETPAAQEVTAEAAEDDLLEMSAFTLDELSMISDMIALELEKRGYNEFESTPASDFLYASNGAEVRINAYAGTGGDVVFPSEIDGQPVTMIAKDAFSHQKLFKAIRLPGRLREIGSSAFNYNYGLTGELILPRTLEKVSSKAFIDANLTGLYIQSDCDISGVQTFAWMDKCRFVYIKDGCQVKMGSTTFSDSETMTAAVIPASVTEMADRAFDGSNMLVIYTTPGSFAEEYAQRNFICVDTDNYELMNAYYSHLLNMRTMCDAALN